MIQIKEHQDSRFVSSEPYWNLWQTHGASQVIIGDGGIFLLWRMV